MNLPTGAYGAAYGVSAWPADAAPVGGVIEAEGAYLEERAHRHNVVLSGDAVHFIVGERDTEEARLARLEDIIARAKVTYPREDGWIVVSRQRIEELMGDHSYVAPPASEARQETMREEESAANISLAEAILAGDITAAYAALGNAPMTALAGAAADLDAVFRGRHGEEAEVSEALTYAASNVASTQLEAAIAALASAIDGLYQDEGAAVKLAIMKAIKATT